MEWVLKSQRFNILDTCDLLVLVRLEHSLGWGWRGLMLNHLNDRSWLLLFRRWCPSCSFTGLVVDWDWEDRRAKHFILRGSLVDLLLISATALRFNLRLSGCLAEKVMMNVRWSVRLASVMSFLQGGRSGGTLLTVIVSPGCGYSFAPIQIFHHLRLLVENIVRLSGHIVSSIWA